MNQKQVKMLRKVFLNKTSAVLLLIREHYGDLTEKFETQQAIWRVFKKMYEEGKVPESLFRQSERKLKLNDNNIEFERSRVQ